MKYKIRILALVILGTHSLMAYNFLGFKWPGSNPIYEFYINEEGTEDVTDEWEHLKHAAEVWEAVPTSVIKTKYSSRNYS